MCLPLDARAHLTSKTSLHCITNGRRLESVPWDRYQNSWGIVFPNLSGLLVVNALCWIILSLVTFLCNQTEVSRKNEETFAG